MLLPWQRFDPRRLPVLLRHRGAWYFASDAADGRGASDGRRRRAVHDCEPRNSTAPKCSGSGTKRPRSQDDAATLSGNLATRLVWKELFRERGWLWKIVAATCLVNLIGVATSLFAMQVYDRVVPTMAYATLDHARRRHGDRGGARLDAQNDPRANPRQPFVRRRSTAVAAGLRTPAARSTGRATAHAGNAGRAGRQPRSRAPVLFRHRRVCAGGSAVRADVSRLHRHHRRRRRVGLRGAVAGGAVVGLRHANGGCGACCAASFRAATSARGCWSTASAAPNRSAPTTPAGVSPASGRRSPPASSATRYSSAPSAVFPRSRPPVSRPSRMSSAVVVGVWQIEAGLLTMGGLIACSILGGRIIAPVAQSVQYLEKWQHVSQSLNMVHQVLALQPERRADQQLLLPDEDPTAIALGRRPLCVRGIADPPTHRRRSCSSKPAIGCCSWVRWARANRRC